MINTVAAKSSLQNPSLEERIDTCVRLLSDQSIQFEGGTMWTGCVLTSEGLERLLWVGKPATSRLLQALHDPDRDLAAHVILTAIWEPEKVSYAGDRRFGSIWFSPGVTRDFRFAQEHWERRIAESPVTERDYRDAEECWTREVSKLVPLMPRAQRKL